MITVDLEDPRQSEVVALLRQSDAVAKQLYPDAFRRPITADSLAKPEIAVLIARRIADGHAIGCRALLDREEGDLELKRMIVDEAARGQGVGAALLRAADAVAQQKGAKAILLEVGTRNVEAQSLYRRAGYCPRMPFHPYSASPISLFLERRF